MGKKRKLIDSCGHERCFTCLYKNEICPVCAWEASLPAKKCSGTRQNSEINLYQLTNPYQSRSKLKTNGHFTPYMQTRNDPSVAERPPPGSRQQSPCRQAIQRNQYGLGIPPSGNRKCIASPRVSRPYWAVNKSGVSEQQDVYNMNGAAPSNQSYMQTRLGLLLGDNDNAYSKTYADHDLYSNNGISYECNGASSNTSPVSTLTGSSEAEVQHRLEAMQSSQDKSSDSMASLMSMSSGSQTGMSPGGSRQVLGRGSSQSPVLLKNRRHSVTTSQPGQVEELSLFGKRKSSVRRSARAFTAKGALESRASLASYWSPQIHLKPLFFEVPQTDLEVSFFGRDWLFQDLERELLGDASHSRGVVISGGDGTGKTAIILQLVDYSCFGRKKEESPYQELYSHNGKGRPPLPLNRAQSSINVMYHKSPQNINALVLASHVVAYHFCQVENNTTCLVPEFVHSVAAQLCQAPQLSGYQDLVCSQPSIQSLLTMKECIANPSKAFVNGILEPLNSLRRFNKVPMNTCLLVIDSIDEAEFHKPDHGDTIADFISKHTMKFPSWFKVIVTVRTQRDDLTKLLPFYRLSLDISVPEDSPSEDLREYVSFRLKHSGTIGSNITPHVSKVEGGGQTRFTSHLIGLSKGSFLYTKLTLDLIERGHLVMKSASFKVLPVNLSEIYMLHFNLRFPSTRSYEKIIPILTTCLASLAPMTALEIYHSVNASFAQKVITWEEFHQRFKVLSSYMVERLDKTYMFFHPTFREWLLRRDGDNAKFLCDLRTGHASLAFRMCRLESPLKPERTLELGHHILKAHIFRSMTKGENMASRDLQALWMVLSSEDLSEALGVLRNIYSPNLKVSRLLLIAGASPDHVTQLMNNSPLICLYAHEGFADMVTLLLEFGANIHASNSHGLTALCLASMRGHVDIVRMLIQSGACPSQVDRQDHCPLVYGAMNGFLNVVSYLLSCDWSYNKKACLSFSEAVQQAFIGAARNGHTHIVEYLLDMAEVSLNGIDTLWGETALTASCLSGSNEVTMTLVCREASIKEPNLKGIPPLLVAVREGHWELADYLIQQGAPIEQTDSYGRTPVMLAAAEGHTGIIELLIERGASISQEDKDGLDALSWACLKKQLTSSKCLLGYGADIKHVDRTGRTPLDLAAQNGDPQLVQFLLEKNANVEHVDMNGMRPLDRAIGCGHIEVVKCFLKKGAKLGPTTWAMASGKPDILLVLLNKLHEDGLALYKKQRLQDAAYRFQYAMRKFPPEPDYGDLRASFKDLKIHLMLNLSRSKRKMKDFTTAMELATKVLKAKPDSFESYYERARAKREAGLTEEAISDLTEAVRLAPQNRDVRRVLFRMKEELTGNVPTVGGKELYASMEAISNREVGCRSREPKYETKL